MPREHTWKQAHSIHVHEIVGPLLKTQKTCIGVKMEGSPRTSEHQDSAAEQSGR